jgi:glycosyltransferase involved in cell wall biosynthesis
MVDVCLIVEGTYPYVKGGVSSWIHQLITNLPNTTFGIVHIAAKEDSTREFKYEIPSNVKILQEIFLHNSHYATKPRFKSIKKLWKDDIIKFHREKKSDSFASLHEILKKYHSNSPFLSFEEMTFSKHSWHIVEQFYNESDPDQSFLDYFWTWRYTHMPLFKILNHSIPQTRVIHTVSTGYAGVLAAFAKIKQNTPLLLTEHGIYTRERKIEIENANWIYHKDAPIEIQEKKDFFKKMWIDFFSFTGKLTYVYADQIITLCGSNRDIEINEGAEEDKIRIIPNGIFPEQYEKVRKRFVQRKIEKPYVIGFVGRVVSIKDIITLIRAIKIIHNTIPEISVLILGPYDEEIEYYHDCVELIKILDLESIISFEGSVKLDEYYHKLDVLLLTSVSEGQPLVILEANCVGIPVVATNVGACKELLYGITPEDNKIGPSGIITEVANPQETADAVIRLLRDLDLLRQYGKNGIKRVYQFYKQQDLLAEYNTLYENLKFSTMR